MMMHDRPRVWTRHSGLLNMAGMLLIALLITAPDIRAEQGGPIVSLMVDAGFAAYSPQAQVSGVLKIQGSDTMSPLMSRLAAEFQRRQPQVTINVKGGGSTKAVSEFLEPPTHGRIVLKEERTNHFLLVATSRELLDSEIKQFVSQHGYEPLSVPVAVDAVALYVHKDNPLPGLTLDQVDAIFSTTRNRGFKIDVRHWGQLGLGNGWEKAEIQLHGRDRKSGTRAFFQAHVLAGGEFAPTLQEHPGAASVILALSHDQFGIAYNGLGLQTSAVRMVPLAENHGMPFVTPSSTTVADQTYPLRRILYVYLDKSPKSSLPPAAQEFLTFITSREGQEAVLRAGFFPLPMNQVTKSFVSLSTNPTPGTIAGQ
jgi:phosphate transport system substrate-binding protein